MSFTLSDKQTLSFLHLPGFAKFLHDERLEELVREQLAISREIKLPLLRFFESFSEEELLKLSKITNASFLTFLIENRAAEHIEDSLRKWAADQLPRVGREQIMAEDITLISFVRKQAFLKFIPDYTDDTRLMLHIIRDLDRYILELETASTNTYLKILKDHINEEVSTKEKIAEQLQHREEQLLEAQEMAGMGSFEWDPQIEEGTVTPQVMKILDLKKGDTFKTFLQRVHPSDRNLVQSAIEKAIEENGVYDCEYRYDVNGSEKILWSRGAIDMRENRPVLKGTVMDVTERNYMIQRLQRSESLYKQAQAFTRIGNYTWDLGTNKISWSDELFRIYEVERGSSDITSELVGSFNHPADSPSIRRQIGQSLETGGPFDFYYRIRLPGERTKILQARGEVLRDENGKPFKILGTAQDVTDRQELIERLQESEYQYKQAQALTHIGNWSWNRTSNEMSWSEELYRIFGINPPGEKITFDRFIAMVHAEDRDMVKEYLAKQHDVHYRIVLEDGTIKSIHGKGEVVSDEQGTIVKVVGTSQDVTEEKLIEKQLRDNQHFIQKIADATPSIITLNNVHTGKYVFVNKGIQKLLGYEPDDVLSQGVAFITKLIHPDDLAEMTDRTMRSLEAANRHDSVDGNEQIMEFQYRLRHINGAFRWFHTYGTAFDRDANGQVEHLLNISLDITESKEAAQVLFQKNLELQRSNASLEEFAYVASHDLQEPLRKISTFGDRLLTTQYVKFDEDGKIYLEKIIHSSLRMQQMINDLLSISIISGNKTFERYSLQSLLNEVLQTLEFKIEETKAVIRADALPEANIVPSQIRQLFQNLLSNSIKFSKKDVPPEIIIQSRILKPAQVGKYDLAKTGDYLQLQFSDNGIGFNKIFAEKIFSIFQRLHSRNEYEGTGIGLAICKKIVENHGGVIFASGMPDAGAQFTVIILL